MIGIFDSGAGGLCALRELARLLPDEKKIYLTDRKNLPYGTKSEGELVLLVSENIRKLRFMGCEKILLACCTASTIHPLLPKEYKELSLPIIGAAARAVRMSIRLNPAFGRSISPPGRQSSAPRNTASTRINKKLSLG